MAEADEWQEMCSVCSRMVGRSSSPRVYRIFLDTWSHCRTWQEMGIICERCFMDIFLSGVRLRGVIDGKISDQD